MASGRTHDVVTMVGAGLLTGTAMAISHDPLLSAAILTGHLFSGLFCSPDVDQPQSRPRQRWLVLSGIWWPFQLFGHRSWLSHTILISSLLRLGYLAMLVAGIDRLYPVVLPFDRLWWFCWSISFILAGETHLLFDYRRK